MSAQGPLVLGLGLKGLGLRVWGQGLTIETMHKVEESHEGKFIKIPPSMNANLTEGNV